MDLKTFTNDIDINLYVLCQLCECSLFLDYPEHIQNKIKTFIFELTDLIFPFSKELEKYDIEQQNFSCTTLFKSNISTPITNKK